MDPYIEARSLWEDFHHHLVYEIKIALADRLPEHYVVRIGVRSYFALDWEDAQERPCGVHPEAQFREPYLEIRRTNPERNLVTRIEILSPSNKRPSTKGWQLYCRDRLRYLGGRANLVEIDLLRCGRRMPLMGAPPDSPYYLLVWRKQVAGYTVWPATFTEPLPPLPIPLAPPDPDIVLDLQPFVGAIYASSRYGSDIDYDRPLDPPMSAGEAAWWERRLRHEKMS
jgi:hypothetical protein